jgi:hypothetical protein
MQGKKSAISKEEVLSTLQRLATDLGRAPTREELEQMSGISPAVVRKHFTRHRRGGESGGAGAGADRAATDDPKRRPAGGLGPGNA